MSTPVRRSVVRRSNNVGSPGFRSRSQERSMLSPATPDVEFQSSFNDDLATIENNDDSERVSGPRNPKRGHHRATSDPFDTAEIGGITDSDMKAFPCVNIPENGVVTDHTDEEEDDDGEMMTMPSSTTLSGEEAEALPTLPRFPVSETRDKNCWSEPPVSIFHVRGPKYLDDKVKVTATNYLLRARGCDLFLANDPQQCVIGDTIKGTLGGNLRKSPSLLIRLTFPWGILVLYFEVPKNLESYLKPAPHPSMEHLSNAERTFAMWLVGDDDYKNERLKLIPYVAEGPWVVRNLVTGKPTIIGKRLPVSYRYTAAEENASKSDFLVCDLDIGNSSAAAKRIVSVCRRYMSALTVDIGFVIQGNTTDELPEQMLGSVRVHKLDPIKAITIAATKERTNT